MNGIWNKKIEYFMRIEVEVLFNKEKERELA
jgi:hypothetical protein